MSCAMEDCGGTNKKQHHDDCACRSCSHQDTRKRDHGSSEIDHGPLSSFVFDMDTGVKLRSETP